MTNRLNTEYVEVEETGRLRVGDVVEITDASDFHEGVKVGQRAVVVQIRTMLFFRLAVLAYEIEGTPHLAFRTTNYEDYEDDVKFLGRQVEADAYQKAFLADLGATQVRVLDTEGFDDKYVSEGSVYPIVGTDLRPVVEYVEGSDVLVDKITGWDQKYEEKVVVFSVGDGFTQVSPLDETIELARAS